MITISYAGQSYTFPNLKDHPLSYSGDDILQGRSVRQWKISGFVSFADAKKIDDIFIAWNTAKLSENNIRLTGITGATIAFTGSAPGFTWTTSVPCFIIDAPSYQMAGAYIEISFTVEDAAQRLAVILREQKDAAQLTTGPTISYAGQSYTFPNLKDHPLSYSGDETSRGRSVRQWKIAGVLSHADAASVDNIFKSWSAARLLEDDIALTGSIGTTVAFSGSAPGFTWSTPVACHFVSAPEYTIAGAFTDVSFILEDANQRLAVVLRQTEEEAEQTAQLNYGTLTFGGAVVNLTSDPNDLRDLPQANLTPAGSHFLTGPKVPTEIRRIQGYVIDAHISLLRAWALANPASSPTTGDWLLEEWTQPTAIRRADNGIMSRWWNVAFTLVKKR